MSMTNAAMVSTISLDDRICRLGSIVLSCSFLFALVTTLFPYEFSYKESTIIVWYNFPILD